MSGRDSWQLRMKNDEVKFINELITWEERVTSWQPMTLRSTRISSLEKQQATGGQNLPRLRSNHCIFCSDPEHYLSSCPHAAEYIQKGLCQKNEGQIVLPNRNQILAKEMRGRNLKKWLDNWHRTNNPPKISTTFVGAAEFKNEYIRPTKLQDSQELIKITK